METRKPSRFKVLDKVDVGYNIGKAAVRGNLYSFLTEAFLRLPDKDFLEIIRSDHSNRFLEQIRARAINNRKIRKGIDAIEDFISETAEREPDSLSEIMAVDRTRLIRPTGERLKAPYEGFYRTDLTVSESLLQVVKFYNRAGILPDNVLDASDFLCIELDFMSHLCFMEADCPKGGYDIRKLEKEFILEHLGRWVGSYYFSAYRIAETGFYKGMLQFLAGFIETEKKYLTSVR